MLIQMYDFGHKMLKMAIYHASVHANDAASEILMKINLKYNTCIMKPIGIIKKLFISFFTKFELVGPILNLYYVIVFAIEHYNYLSSINSKSCGLGT